MIDAEHDGYLVTLGYLITMAIAVPFSIIDIVDWCQGIMYTISLLCVLEMIVDFWYIAEDPAFRAANQMAKSERLTAWGYNLGLVRRLTSLNLSHCCGPGGGSLHGHYLLSLALSSLQAVRRAGAALLRHISSA